MTERIRRNPIQIYFSDGELERLNERMKEFGVENRSNFIRKLSLNGYMVKLDEKPVREAASLLRRCSNNLNQYARMANATGSIYEKDIHDLEEKLEEIWKLMKKIIAELSGVG